MATPEEDKRIAEAVRERIGAESCLKPREAYSLCFNKWYSEAYLPSGGRVELGCQDLFATYQECLDAELKKKGLAHLKEGSDPTRDLSSSGGS